MSTIFSLLYFLHASSIYILVYLLVEYSNYSNKHGIQRCSTYQKEGAYFSVDTQRCGTYLRPEAYQRKYGNSLNLHQTTTLIFHHSSVNYRTIQYSTAPCVNVIRRFILEINVWKFLMIYFYQSKLLHMYFSKIMKTFYDLLFTRSNCKWL